MVSQSDCDTQPGPHSEAEPLTTRVGQSSCRPPPVSQSGRQPLTHSWTQLHPVTAVHTRGHSHSQPVSPQAQLSQSVVHCLSVRLRRTVRAIWSDTLTHMVVTQSQSAGLPDRGVGQLASRGRVSQHPLKLPSSPLVIICHPIANQNQSASQHMKVFQLEGWCLTARFHDHQVGGHQAVCGGQGSQALDFQGLKHTVRSPSRSSPSGIVSFCLLVGHL